MFTEVFNAQPVDGEDAPPLEITISGGGGILINTQSTTQRAQFWKTAAELLVKPQLSGIPPGIAETFTEYRYVPLGRGFLFWLPSNLTYTFTFNWPFYFDNLTLQVYQDVNLFTPAPPAPAPGELKVVAFRVNFNWIDPAGFLWLPLSGGSIGNDVSGALYPGGEFLPLYQALWPINAYPVSGGRGISASQDYHAGKTLTLPDARGRAIVGAGLGADLTVRAIGELFGAENHALTVAQMPSHSHTGTTNITGAHSHPIGSYFAATAGGPGFFLGGGGNVSSQSSGNHSHTLTINSSGNGQSFPLSQPSIAQNVLISTGVIP